MSTLNTSVLVAARETYTEHLKNYLTPLIFEGFASLYEDALIKENAKPEFNYNYLKQFQTLLKDIPYWNQSILEEETRRILDKVDFLMKILAAVFVSYVKILASVRIGGQSDKIRIQVPLADIFIHTVYCKAAEMIYYDPYKFRNYHLRENREYITDMINKSIDISINNMIPIENILKEYLSSVYSGYIKNTGSNGNESNGYTANFNGNEMGLMDNKTMISETTQPNHDFGAGNNFRDDDILDQNYKVGSDPLPISDPFKSSDIPFKTSDDPFKTSDDPFKTSDDPFKAEEPFKEPNEMVKSPDPFGAEDIFASKETSNDIFNNSAPIPPELGSNEIFSNTPDVINFEKDLL